MIIRPAAATDAPAISGFLAELVALGKRTLPHDLDFVRTTYISDDNNIRCSVAEDTNGGILGLQVLKRADENNQYGVTPGWGIIGTHVRPSAARRGVGRALFAATLDAARSAGLAEIDASISAKNTEGLAYYEAIGFRTYRTPEGKICKRFSIA